MNVSNNKRRNKRMDCKIPIPVHVSLFNSQCSIEAQMVDHCIDGISFITDQAFFPGSAIVIRITYSKLKDSCNSELKRLPSMIIGEVKWCRKLPIEASTAYEVGINYYQGF